MNTTANNKTYIGRFAPSPTGPMHFGTLIAAVASYLQAKSNKGKWLLRMEDVDVLRNVAGCDTQILQSLERFGFEWDDEVLYQTSRTQAYEQALTQLKQQALLYPCTCSRKQLAQQTGEWSPVYPGTCRRKDKWTDASYATRVKTPDRLIVFNDIVCGPQQQNIANEVGDFVIKRRDGLFAYQLAVVVDDAYQGVTQVVRGTDLMDSTPRQIFLQQTLAYRTPEYLHFPIAIDKEGNKLSKSTQATKLDDSKPITSLNAALMFLGQQKLDTNQLDEFWETAIENWNSDNIPKQKTISI